MLKNWDRDNRNLFHITRKEEGIMQDRGRGPGKGSNLVLKIQK